MIYLLQIGEFLLKLPLLGLSFGQDLFLPPSLLLQDGDTRWKTKSRASLCLFDLSLLKAELSCCVFTVQCDLTSIKTIR